MSILASQSANRAILVLADGTIFRGTAIGAEGSAVGEVVFNTAMTGYQEILTDPSYTEQLVTLTYPHIGNTGTNDEDEESDAVWAKGLIIRDNALKASNFRKQETLNEYLRRHNVVGIADIDTRKLTRILREKGAQNGCIMAGELDDAKALELAQQFPGLKGMDLAKEVSCKEAYEWSEGEWTLGEGYADASQGERPYHVVAFDYGVKFNILRMLAARDYLAIAGRFAGLVLADIPQFTESNEHLARRFMWLIDALYDRGRFLVASAATDINDLYAGHQWRFEFDRTASRLGEMVARGQTTGS